MQIQYSSLQQAVFVDQLVFSQSPTDPVFSAGGDSGSLIYDETHAGRRTLVRRFPGIWHATRHHDRQSVELRGGSTQHRSARNPSEQGLLISTIQQVLDEHRADLMHKPGVLSVAVGLSRSQPGRTKILIYCDRHVDVPATLDGFEVETITTPPFRVG